MGLIMARERRLGGSSALGGVNRLCVASCTRPPRRVRKSVAAYVAEVRAGRGYVPAPGGSRSCWPEITELRSSAKKGRTRRSGFRLRRDTGGFYLPSRSVTP